LQWWTLCLCYPPLQRLRSYDLMTLYKYAYYYHDYCALYSLSVVEWCWKKLPAKCPKHSVFSCREWATVCIFSMNQSVSLFDLTHPHPTTWKRIYTVHLCRNVCSRCSCITALWRYINFVLLLLLFDSLGLGFVSAKKNGSFQNEVKLCHFRICCTCFKEHQVPGCCQQVSSTLNIIFRKWVPANFQLQKYVQNKHKSA